MSSGIYVTSYHINVKVGDAAIHLVIKGSSGNEEVLRAVLIDGGSSKRNDILGKDNALKRMIDRLSKLYGTVLAFDTIVISHWDEDHYGGLVDLLRADMVKAVESNEQPSKVLTYLKWKRENNEEVPETYLYCPNEASGGASVNGLPRFFRRGPDPTTGIFVQVCTDKDPKKYTGSWKSFARLRSAEKASDLYTVLGTNFFANKELTNNPGKVTPADLMVKNPPESGWPGMYCIGVKNKTFEMSKAPRIIPEGVTKTNQWSITCVILWPSAGGGPPKCSHYSAGDADEKREAEYMEWLQVGGITSMTNMKLSHHGSRSSTPLTSNQLFPVNIIISNPTGYYFHPGWETMFYFCLFTRYSVDQNPSMPARVFATKYPFYLCVDNAGEYINLGKDDKLLKTHAFDNAPSGSAFREYLTKAYNEIQGYNANWKAVVSELDEYKKVGKDPKEQRKVIMDLLKARWDMFCWPGADTYSNADFPTGKPNAQKTTTLAVPECLVVRSANDSTDGQISYMEYNSSAIKSYNRPTTTTAQNSNAVLGRKRPINALNTGNTIPGWMTVPKKMKRGKQKSHTPVEGVLAQDTDDTSVDRELANQPVTEKGAFYTQQGTNINEMDHPDWPVDVSTSEQLPTKAPDTAQFSTSWTIQPSLPDDDDTDNWYIYSSNIPQTSVEAVTQRYTILSPEDPWDGWIASLHCAVISLTADPGDDPEVQSTPLSGDDELACWFQDTLAATDVVMIKYTGSQAASVGGFAVSTSLVGSGGTQPEPPIALLFSSERNALSNAFAGSPLPPMGLRDGSTSLVMALDTRRRKPETVSMATLATFVGLDDLFESPFLALLKDLRYVIPAEDNPGTGHRNAIWFVPQQSYATTTRLQLDLSSDDLGTLQTFLDVLHGRVTGAYVIARRRNFWTSGETTMAFNTEGELVLVAEIEVDKLEFNAVMELRKDLLEVSLILKTRTGPVLDTVLSWLKNSIIGSQDDDPFPFREWLRKTAETLSFPEFDFRRVVISYTPRSQDSTSMQFSCLSLDMEMQVKARNQRVLTLVTFVYSAYGGPGTTLTADLWVAPTYDVHEPALRVLPDFENYAWFEPLGITTRFEEWPKYLDLASLAGLGSEDSPPGIFPTILTMARLHVNKDSVAFSGVLQAKPITGGTGPPIFSIDQVDLFAEYAFGSHDGSGIAIELGVRALIQPPPDSDIDPAEIKAEFLYPGSSKPWSLKGSVDNLLPAHFYQFFPDDIRAAAAALLDGIVVRSFDIDYSYAKGEASMFQVSGVLGIGALDFALSYSNYGSAKPWDFYAGVAFNSEADQQHSSFLAMLANLVDLDSTIIPSFLGNIDVSMNNPSDEIGLRLVSDPESQSMVFTLWARIGSLRIQYIQCIHDVQSTMSATGTASYAKAKASVKRVLLTSVDKIMEVDVPLLGNITQPFDEALAMWVQARGSEGLTLDELALVNSVITADPLNQKPLPYKSVKKDPGGRDVVLINGVHLMLVLKNANGATSVALDYVFGNKQSAMNTGALKSSSDGDGESGMVEYPKTANALSVRNLGLKYADDILSIKVDGEVKLGPISFAVQGFAIHLEFSPGGNSSLFLLPRPSVSLEGLSATFDSPPIKLEGMLLHAEDPTLNMYAGALVAGYVPWLFSAAGCYGEVKGLEGYKTFFVYARLNGPLITLGFATISGVVAGFGYNSTMRFPAAASVEKYPLIQVPTPPDATPQEALLGLIGEWFSPKEGSFWVAAGLNVIAFKMVEFSAVIAVEWDPNIKIGVFALGDASIPPKVGGGSGSRFAHVQLGMTAIIDVAAGTMKLDGQLTPASYILDPNCHLTGGFAMYTWFGDAAPELKGDWVFTIGGYHRQFKLRPQYPTPPRLGISWKFDSAISIRGEAYFAITPKVCMGGGRLDVSLSLGPLQAYYNAFIDFLINFSPFYFIADGGISVGVKFTLDLWLVTIHISVDLSASLHIEGPPIHGTVHVNFWVFGFDINFGSRGPGVSKLTLDEFITLACESDATTQSVFHTIGVRTPVGNYPKPYEAKAKAQEGSLLSDGDPRKPHILVVQSGLIPENKTTSEPSGGLWQVRAANFSFAVSCKVPVEKATIVTGRPEEWEADNDPEPHVVEGTGNPINARPMCDTKKLSSEVTITITPEPPNPSLLTVGEKLYESVPVWNNNVGIFKNLPAGLWGKYDPAKDPTKHANNPDYLNGNSADCTVSLLCGVTITVPKPLVSEPDTTWPFDFKKYMVLEIESDFHFPRIIPEEPVFQPAPVDEADRPKQWDAVRDAWNAPELGEGASMRASELWQEVGLSDLGWDPNKTDSEAGHEFVGRVPAAVVKDLEDYYLWAPFLTNKP